MKQRDGSNIVDTTEEELLANGYSVHDGPCAPGDIMRATKSIWILLAVNDIKASGVSGTKDHIMRKQ